MAAPFKVKAVYEYASQEADDLSFPLGQIITVTEEIDADWYEGEYTDITGIKKAGIFPNNFVEKYEPEVPSRPARPSRPGKDVTSPPRAEPVNDKQEEPVEEPTAQAPAIASPKQAEVATLPPSQPVESRAPPPQPTAPVAETKKAPPVAPKSNAFKDRIAAFNQPAAAPILPFTPGQRAQPSTFIKKPFVAPPPSKDSYIPPPKQETVHRAYVREEDPEIKRRQEEDQAAAQNAGLLAEEHEGEEVGQKPTSLKDRIALLQKQQLEQAQRRADTVKKEKKPAPPPRQVEDDVPEDEPRGLSIDEPAGRKSIDSIQGQPPVPIQKRSTNPPTPAIPQHELLSGGEEADQSAAGETTEDDAGTIGPEEGDETTPVSRVLSTTVDEEEPAEPDEEEEEEEEEEDDMDDETRRKLELRERMAKMSGGMGMAGMFGPPGGIPLPGAPPKKRTSTKEKRSTEGSTSSAQAVPPVPMEGLQRVTSPDAIAGDTTEDARGLPPPLPKDPGYQRAAPPLPPPDSRPNKIAQTPGEDDTDDAVPAETPGGQTPLPIHSAVPPVPRSASIQHDARNSYFADNAAPSSRAPPIPAGTPMGSPRPPPPPPTVPPRSEDNDERGESEYEGDYDTDIGSSAKHKDALRAHAREPSIDDSTTADEGSASPVATTTPAISRAAPPPPPSHAVPKPSRQSTDLPRAPPPPVPSTPGDDGDYDPYRYADNARPPPPIPTIAPVAVPPVPPRVTNEGADSSDDLYAAPPPRKSMDRPPPPPPPAEMEPLPVSLGPPPSQPPRLAPRQSLDVQSSSTPRRSMDQARPSGEHGQIATDLDLAEASQWWASPQALPPSLQNRVGVDILTETEESTTSKRGGRTTVSKEVYILYLDYSQTVITARYDSREPADVSLEQRHEPPPAKLRQDQLETFWTRFGQNIAETASVLGNSKKESTVGDGSAASLIYELIKGRPEALLPVGTRAYGALVYANLANASVMQFDEIRPGDVLTLRNAKFEGKHSGPMHQKYKQELGPSHVALVHEWDGTKKKLRAWEQGKEKKGGLRSESYRLADLKSGEVRVWRVVGREWVGWDSNA